MPYTPGPWTSFAMNGGGIAIENQKWGIEKPAWAIAGRTRIATVGILLDPSSRTSSDRWYSDLDDEANARLISAAPDLLAALKAIESIIDGRQPIDVPGAVMVARAAIAKAESGR